MKAQPADSSIPFSGFYHETKMLVERPKFILEPLALIQPVLSAASLIKGLLGSTGLAVLFGLPGTGKSFVALAAALHVSAGISWAGRKVRKTGVVYVAAEGQTGFRKRVFAARLAFGIPPEAPFALITVAPNLGVAEGDALVLIRDIRSQADVIGLRVGLIVLDTVARTLLGADENSARDVGLFIANADLIGREFEACVLAVHHAGKTVDRGMRGSSALHGATDAEWVVSAAEDGLRTVTLAKMKDDEDGLSFSFRLRSFEVGHDQDGDPVTTCVAEVLSEAEHQNVPVVGGPKKLTGQKAEFVKAVALAIGERGEAVPTSDHVPASTKGVRRQELARYAEQLGFTDGATPDARKAVRNRLIRVLCGEGHLSQWGEWIWIAR